MTKKYTYRPHLRSKSGEARALDSLTAASKLRMHPHINLVEKVPATFSQDVAASWVGLPLALDGTFNSMQKGTLADFDRVFHDLGSNGVAVTPSLHFGASGPYLANVQSKVGTFTTGLTLTVKFDELPSAAWWAKANGFILSDVDLVVNLYDVAGYSAAVLHPSLISGLSHHVTASVWRSVTLVASSSPRDTSALSYGRNVIPRRCLDAWVSSHSAVPYDLHFGDYATTTPDFQDPPGYVMSNVTVSVRYTTDNELIVRKGKVTKGKTGLPMPDQYRDHAKALLGESAFGGLSRCWGDTRIGDIHLGAATPGNRTTWASIAASRHMSLMADRLP